MSADPWAVIEAAFPKPPPPERPAPTYTPNPGNSPGYAIAALNAEVGRVLLAVEGERNHTLNRAAFSLGQLVAGGVLDQSEVRSALAEAALAIGLEPIETDRTITSGLRSGATTPRGVPERDPFPDLPAFAPAAGAAAQQAAGDLTEMTPEQRAEWARQRQIAAALHDLRIRHEALTLHKAELAARTFREPPYRPTLTAELLMPDEPVQYAIDDLLPIGGNALLAAQYKTGKTTVIGNYARAFADSEPFLGRFSVNPAQGRVAIWNYELSDSQFRRWLREFGIKNTDAVVVLHLRGYRLPITAPSVEDWIVRWLEDNHVTAWVPDPFARAAVGTDENSNTEVGVWLDTLDIIKERAGVRDLILPTHTGRAEQEQGQERARGATRLDDWADVRWLLTKDDTDNRFFRATGRDVELPEELLTYDPTTRGLVYGGGDRRWVKGRETAQRVLDFVNANPGCTAGEIERCGGNKQANASARDDLIRRHKIRSEEVRAGKTTAIRHYANEELA